MNTRLNTAVVVSALLLASAPVNANPIIDAFGDAQDIFGTGGPLLDIDAIDIAYDESFLYFSLSFHTSINPPSSGLSDGLYGVIEFDTDQSTRTGAPPLQSFFSPPFAVLDTGVDFLVDLASESLHPGSVDIRTGMGDLVDTIAVRFEETEVSGMIALTSLGGDDGIVDFTTIIGTFEQPTDATDVVGTSKAIPAPAAVTVLLLAGIAPRRRRRHV